MSETSELLQSVCGDGIDNKDMKKTFSKIFNEIKRYQEKTKIYIEENYENFIPDSITNAALLEDGEKLIREIDDLLERLVGETKTQLSLASDEVERYKEELEEVKLGLQTAYKIMQIDELFQCLEDAKSKREFLLVLEIVGKLKSLIMDTKDPILPKLLCFKNLKIKYHVESELLIHNLKQCFEQLVEFNEKLFDSSKSVTLKISKDENKLSDILIALFNARYKPIKLCDFLFSNIFEPIITRTVSLDLNDECSDEYVELLLSYSLREPSPSSELPTKPSYKTVFENITAVLACLSYINVQLSDTVCVMNILSGYFKSKFLDLLINECLMYSIPRTVEEMRESTLVQDVLNFNKILGDMNMIKIENDKHLIRFTENVGIIFKNRFTTKVLHDTIDILRKDLHDMTLVAEKNVGAKLEVDPFLFPKCMISKSILELINVMKNVIEEAFAAKEEKVERFSIISSVVEQYIIEVPRYHENMLNMIPQQTALFYNNCMYLAHWITKNCDKNVQDFPILAQSLQNLGNEYFSKQVKTQHTQLHEILKGFDLADAVSEIAIESQKVIRQCLRQMELLKNVWQNILSEPFYVKQISGLLNDFCQELIRKIMSIEDISTTVSNELSEIISIVEDRAPKLFEDKRSIIQVKTWSKLIQLKMILGATLLDITDQWADGKGPLTLNFKAEEVKRLIRALFQNTERRANALAMIV